jgi:hypothetical protein
MGKKDANIDEKDETPADEEANQAPTVGEE